MLCMRHLLDCYIRNNEDAQKKKLKKVNEICKYVEILEFDRVSSHCQTTYVTFTFCMS
jgi:hypothetical protein